MITDKEAISKAVDYLKSLSSEQSGELLSNPDQDSIKLEEVRQAGDEWIVVLGYTVNPSKEISWLDTIREHFKEIVIDGKRGMVTAMRNPTLA